MSSPSSASESSAHEESKAAIHDEDAGEPSEIDGPDEIIAGLAAPPPGPHVAVAIPALLHPGPVPLNLDYKEYRWWTKAFVNYVPMSRNPTPESYHALNMKSRLYADESPAVQRAIAYFRCRMMPVIDALADMGAIFVCVPSSTVANNPSIFFRRLQMCLTPRVVTSLIRTRDVPEKTHDPHAHAGTISCGSYLNGKTAVIIDDIITSGAQMSVAVQACRAAGALDVYCLAIGGTV